MPTVQKSEIRRSYLSDKYVIITPLRARRPRDIREETVIKRTADCQFCAAELTNELIKDSVAGPDGAWRTAALDNIYPAVSLDNDAAYGVQEVIVETQDHLAELADLDTDRIEAVLRLWGKRTAALAAVPGIDYILCFKNQGSKAGASIVHAHSQVFATKIVPPDVAAELKLAQDYRAANGNCAYCDIIGKEMKTERRIYEDAQVAVFTPYASEYHYEAWIMAKRHVDNLTQLDDAEFTSLAAAYQLVLTKLKALDLSFNAFCHQVVSAADQHLIIKIQPRDSVWAGVELGSGLVINSIPPEAAAKYYRGEVEV